MRDIGTAQDRVIVATGGRSGRPTAMEKKLMGIAATVAIIAFSVVAEPAAAAEVGCDVADARQLATCLVFYIDTARSEIYTRYRAALATMPDADPTDRRKSKAQLIAAEAAWRTYVDAHCAYVGGAEGGSNQWVTIFAEQCELDETTKRIEFLRHPSWAEN